MKHSFSILTAVFAVFAFLVSCGGSEGTGSGGSGNNDSGETGSIYGIVTDKATGESIINAGVELQPVGLKTVTGSDGQFEFNEVATGTYTLYVTKTGYSDNSSSITVDSGKQSKGDVQLEKLPAALRIVDDAGNDITELDFGSEIADVSRQFNIFNDSSFSIDWQISKTAEWIKSISEESGNLGAGDTLGIIIKIDRSLLLKGENTTQLHITSNNGNKALTIKATDSDACNNNPCGEHGTCKATGAETYECKCDDGYVESDNKCVAETKTAKCEDKPKNSVWNDDGANGTFLQTWDGEEFVPETKEAEYSKKAKECAFICAEGFYWNEEKCEIMPTQTVNCEGLPENAHWNTASSITQTWDGEEWQPQTTGVYNEEESMSECHFKCNTNYEWKGASCEALSRTSDCEGIPANAVWNSVSSITQTWDGSTWKPSTVAAYNTESSSNECRFRCNKNYTWDNYSECVADTKTVDCSGLPEDAQWNSVSSITQTWNGSDWIPGSTAVYNTTSSANECRFKCNTNYVWNNSECEAGKQTANCTGLPSNAVWNSASSITQTWNGLSWQPNTEGTYNTTASSTECRFKCDTNYSWKDSKCVANTQTVNCTGLPVPGGVWNTTSSVEQTWNGSAWTPASTATYNTNSSETECRFKCDTNYTWNGTICKANQKVENCTGLPANAKWNTASTITQTWNGYDWAPTTTGSYSTTESTTECKYVCKPNFFYDPVNSLCVNPCHEDPCSGIEHATSGCVATDWDEFSCECEKGYEWDETKCEAIHECGTDKITPCLDSATGLVWSAAESDNSPTKTGAAAVYYCNNLTEGGFTDWRLPNIDELRSLLNCSKTGLNGTCKVSETTGCLSSENCWTESTCATCGTSSASTIGKFADSDWFWSSSVVSEKIEDRWIIDFSVGRLTNSNKEHYLISGGYTRVYVRCVR